MTSVGVRGISVFTALATKGGTQSARSPQEPRLPPSDASRPQHSKILVPVDIYVNRQPSQLHLGKSRFPRSGRLLIRRS